MGHLPLRADEVERLIELLARKPGDLRGAALRRLRALPDADLLAAADRLLADAGEPRRLAGLELLRDAAEAGRCVPEVRARAEAYAQGRESLGDAERAHLAAMLGAGAETDTLEDALGLIDPARRRRWPAPRARRVELDTRAARRSLQALAELILEHQATEVPTRSGEAQMLVEATPWNFGPRRTEEGELSDGGVPLAELWREWARARPDALRDADGCELLRALVVDEDSAPWKAAPVREVVGLGRWHSGHRFLRGLLEWCAVWDPAPDAAGFLLEGLENALATLDDDDYRELAARAGEPVYLHIRPGERVPAFREKMMQAEAWFTRLRWWRDLFPGALTPAQAERIYGLLRGFEARSGGFGMLRLRWTTSSPPTVRGGGRAGVRRPAGRPPRLPAARLAAARGLGAQAAEARCRSTRSCSRSSSAAAAGWSRSRACAATARASATGLAMELRATGGLDTLMLALPALGKSHFSRSFGWAASGASRQETLSHLVRA
jgi:hypothetical protein